MNVTWKWLTGSIVAVAAVALGVSVGILLSRTIGSDGRATQTVGTDRPATDTPRLSGQALGPIELGMSRRAALATGWLGDAQETCSDIIGGGAEPGEYSYELDGEQSPGSLSGQVEFFDDRVTMIQVNSEVELPNGVTFDTGWDNPTAEREFTERGYSFSSGEFFDSNDAATVRSPGGDEFGMYFSYSEGSAVVAIPDVTVCD
ncbi:MAG: hypothetical protein V9F00_14355 [Nocardioides sp.]